MRKIRVFITVLMLVLFSQSIQSQEIIGYSGWFTFNTVGAQLSSDFSADTTSSQINQPIQFSDLSTGIQNPESWTWNFGAGASPATANTQGPHTVTYSSAGSKTVSLSVINAAGVSHTTTKTDYITVNSQNNGISLKIIETNPGAGPIVSKVGYYYTINEAPQGGGLIRSVSILENNFIVDQSGEVSINFFPTYSLYPSLTKAFNNEIILFDQDNNQIGHIPFEYDPSKENNHKREAILILHNDNEICQGGNEFPYNAGTDGYEKRWKYYKIGEYPVSMLIPPNNTFQATYTKMPLLLIHGWEGSYALKNNPDATAGANETSYWFTTVKKLNKASSEFDAWEYYYPYNSAHKHLAICLKSALEHLKTKYISQKIRLTTHSMGGLVTLRYLTQFSESAQTNVEKVLFMAPPAHGSLGANLYYKTTAGPLLQLFVGYDRYAPSVRDMKLGSDAIWDIHNNNNNLPDLGNENGVADDYFVMLGTTYKYYLSDIYFLSYNENAGAGLVHSCLHPEASNHHDGIVSISSGSLLDKVVGFATFHGNHNDAVHMQSFKRKDPNNQNIGKEELLPNIITQYFTNSYADFTNMISENQYITAIINADRTIEKPAGQNWEDLNTNNGVNYQKGILNIDFAQKPSPETYQAIYNEGKKVLKLYPKFVRGNFLFKGVFKTNTSSLNGKRYYYNDDNTIFKEDAFGNKAVTYNGCAIDLKQGWNSIYICNIWGQVVARGIVNFKYCETNNVTINNSNKLHDGPEDNYTDTKEKYIVYEGISVPDSSITSFYVDDQATLVEFRVSSLESVFQNFPIKLKLKLPDGTLGDSTFAGATYIRDYELGNISMEIPDPIPGKWHVWLESENQEAIANKYSAVAFFQSEIQSYLPDTTEIIAANASSNLRAGLKVNDFNSTSELNVIATVNKPDGEKDIINITSTAIMQDSSYLFTLNYTFSLPGEYLVKYNIDGVYNNFNFERCLYRSIEAVDTIPVLNIPDFSLRQFESQKVLDLDKYIYNINNYDTLFFSLETLSSDLDSLTFSASLDSLTLYSYINTNLADTGKVIMRYNCHFDGNIVSDTVVVSVLMPELSIENTTISDSIFNNTSDIILNYTLANNGNYHSSEYEVRYYITQDSLLQQTDYCLGSKTILQHSVDSLIILADTLQIPVLDLVGNYKLLIMVDAGNQIYEPLKSNNQAILNIYMNPSPQPPIILSAIPDDGSVHLTWSSNHQQDISGYIIHYGTDSIWSINKIYPLNNDTTYTITGLTNNVPYYFALSAYKIMGVNSDPSDFISAQPGVVMLAVNVFLEGAFNGNDAMNSSLATDGLVPLTQPYNTEPWNYNGIETLTALPPDMVDWVLVELRDAANPGAATPSTIVAGWPRAMLIKSDGSIVDLNGNIPSIGIPAVSNNPYVVIRHRNHLDVMSSEPLILSENNLSYDFTDALTKAYGGAAGYKQIGAGVFGMVAADIDANGAIGATDFNIWAQRFGLSGVYNAADTDMDGQVSTSDFNKWSLNFGEQIIIDGINKNHGYHCQVPINE